jgi:lysophospholipase L1-like esterase
MGHLGIVIATALVGCGGGGGGPDGGTGDDTPDAEVGPTAEVHYVGRFTDAREFAWPGSRIVTRFRGTTLRGELEDGGNNFMEVFVDGEAVQVLDLVAGRETYELAAGLSDGEHDLVLARRTESFWGSTTFHGFSGSPLVATQGRGRMIELVGDSITCGYGVLGVGPSCEFDAVTEAETHAWGTFAADALDADHAAIAYSGIGMFRNNGGGTGTMPERYGRTLAEDPSSTWSFAYTPDVVVIALGTNDFAGGDPGPEFQTAYVDFIEMVRGRFPDTRFLVATSPMMSGEGRSAHRAYLDGVAAAFASTPGLVTVVEIAEQDPEDGYGCDYHPSEATELKMAQALVPAIRDVTGW